MNNEASAHWAYAIEDLNVARHDLAVSPRNAATRAYYAAFHAVAALFALEDRSFSKHSALESAVHRDLVRPGRVPETTGVDYSALFKLRLTSDYDVAEPVSREAAESAIAAAGRILENVRRLHPEFGRNTPPAPGPA
jgi:hypothetical protein